MVKIRLRRVGAKKQPHYRVVVADSRAPRDGRFIEMIGHYNPRTEPPTMVVDLERARYWLGVGAQPTDAVRRILEKLMAEEVAGEVTAETAVAEAEAIAEMAVAETEAEAVAEVAEAEDEAVAETAEAEEAEEEATEELSAVSSEPETEAVEAEPVAEAAPEVETAE
jgi:small subunit ribosomal protein S16